MSAADQMIGHILDGRYKVLEPISEGAMGVVYRGERLKLGRPVAIKVLRDELPNELASRKRFEVEAMAMAKLEHPHCVSVLDVGLHEDKPYVVMDFVSGTNLRELVDRDGALDTMRAAEIMRQVLSGLAHAHELGIMHRDIKPANVMLGHKTGIGDQVKILDFGLARQLDGESNITGSMMVLGTPAYMAPEQCSGGVIDARTDLYACGVLLFELLTGHKPFHSEKDDPIEVVRMHLDKPPPRLADMAPGKDFGELEDVVARALAKSPKDRYQTAGELSAAIAQAAGIRPRANTPAQIPAAQDLSWIAPASTVARAVAGKAAPAEPVATAAKSAAPATSEAPAKSTPKKSVPPTKSKSAAKLKATSDEPDIDAGWADAKSKSAARPDAKSKRDAKSAKRDANTKSADDDWRVTNDADAIGSLPTEPATPDSVTDAASAKARASDSPSGAIGTLPTEPASAPDVPRAAGAPDAPAHTNGSSGTAKSDDLSWGLPKPEQAGVPVASDPVAQITASRDLKLPPRRVSMKMIGVAAAALGVLVVIIIGAVNNSGSSTSSASAGVAAQPATPDGSAAAPTTTTATGPTTPTPPAPPIPPPPPDEPVPTDGPGKVIHDATALAAGGKLDAAITMVRDGRKQYYANPDLPLLAGKLYFARRAWTDGVAAFREAFRLDDSLKTIDIARLAVDAFLSTTDRSAVLASFVADDLGAFSGPLLDDAIAKAPSPASRQRATAERARIKK